MNRLGTFLFRRRLFVLRPAALWQADLFIAIWCMGFAALGGYAAGIRAPHVQDWERQVLEPRILLSVFGGVLLSAIGVRSWMLRRDFRLVTDYESYFFYDANGETVLCRRGELLGHRDLHEGILLEIGETKTIIEEPVELLITVHNILARWDVAQGAPSEPPHLPPWAR